VIRVFSRISYVFLALITALIGYCLLVWIPVWNLFYLILFTPGGSLFSNAQGALRLLYFALLDPEPTDALYAIALSLLIGINAALLVFYFKLHRAIPSKVDVASGVVGSIAAILGFGCAACGSLFATALISAIAGAGFAAKLPLDGPEFQILGVLLLLFSIFHLARAINKPLVCPI